MARLKGSKRLGQWVASPKVKIIERFNKGKRRDVALVLELKHDGRKARIAVFPTTHKAGTSDGLSSRTEARKKGVEAYPISAETLLRCKHHKPKFAVLFLTDTEGYMVSKFEDWFDPTKRKRAYSRSGSGDNILLATQHMKIVPGYKVLN